MYPILMVLGVVAALAGAGALIFGIPNIGFEVGNTAILGGIPAFVGGLILIAQDQDFGELVILRQLPVVGVVLLEVARLPLKAQVERIAQLVAADHTSLAGNLTVIEPGRTRVRPLPDSSP